MVLLDIIKDMLEEIAVLGAGETPSAEDADVCMRAINNILDSWRLENLTVYDTTMVSAALPANTVSLAIGPALALNTTRPVRLEEGCYITVGNLDFPLRIVERAEYNDIVLKTMNGPWPAICCYDANYPTGSVLFWPQGACTVNLNVATVIPEFTLTSQSFALPPGYRRALALTGAEEVATKFERQLSPATAVKARAARRSLKRSNVAVPQLDVAGQSDFGPRQIFFGLP